ncbi:tetratricopeptide repeat protein [Fulvivirga sp. RKSG066]|uniref:ATP-binding protein n=1 Tax=Fulvivirga aurantia TaxID=2529383 RepID=UPI0012BC2B0D|nr:tetratricopeptide repeat protein [Fulvivirga aurantia]MTI21577.1 tetratricopeptide repeat protein [Fulvivirga aurantia]
MKNCNTIFLAVLLSVLPTLTQAQNDLISPDSLRQVYNTTSNDSIKLRIAYYLISEYEISDPDSAYQMALHIKELAEQENDTTILASIYRYLGVLAGYRGEHYQALQFDFDALRLYESVGDEEGIARVWNNLGEGYYELDLFNEAYDYYYKSLNRTTEIGDSLGAAIATYNVGRVLKAMGQLKKAKVFIVEAKELSEKIGDKEGIPYALNDLGDIYLAEGKYDLALETLNEALEKCKEYEEVLDVYILAPEILEKIAQAYRAKRDYAAAIDYHDQAIEYYENLGNESGIAEINLGKGRTLMASGDLDEAARFLNTALSIANDENNKGLQVQVYQELSKLYELKGEFQRSLELYKKFKTLGDELYSEKKSEQFSQLQIKYETQKKDIEIALLNQREEQRQAQLKNEEFLRNILVVILAFTAVLLVTLYRSGARRKKINELLIVHQKEIEAQSKELESLLELKDKFFSIVSHDLRSPINALVGILDMLNEGHLTQEELVQLTRSLKIRLDNTRKLLDNLLDWAMVQMNEIEIKEEEIKLKLTVEDNLTFFREVNDKNINFFNKVQEEVALADRNMLDLVIRNLVSNSIKFTQEKGTVEVFAEDSGQHWIICISDNGVGMSQEQVGKVFDNSLIYTTPGTSNEKGTGIGLKLCKEFVDRMGGKIWVESEEGKGSTFKFTVKKAESTE